MIHHPKFVLGRGCYGSEVVHLRAELAAEDFHLQRKIVLDTGFRCLDKGCMIHWQYSVELYHRQRLDSNLD